MFCRYKSHERPVKCRGCGFPVSKNVRRKRDKRDKSPCMCRVTDSLPITDALRPCHPAWMTSGRRRWCGVFLVVKTAQSRGRTERTRIRHFCCHITVCYTQVIMPTSADAFPEWTLGATLIFVAVAVAVWLGLPLAGFSSRCWLSPLFYEDAQIVIFPAPISCLGDRHLRAAGDAFG